MIYEFFDKDQYFFMGGGKMKSTLPKELFHETYVLQNS